MTVEFYTIPKDWFTDLVIEKFRAYAIVDVENKLRELLVSDTNDEFIVELIAKLNKERMYYYNTSKQKLLDELIVSASDRYYEEDMNYSKQVFDMVLAKHRFGSYH
ncbi:hypothetical protein [Lysinibacillus capsici]|uniref:hypothetical protein n=1 Tax=Lysinibacillus capsici TaxID=2115968 RepID=UPI002E228804|nr:hypothetical protein [Lysinibacillus capsici]